MEDFNRLLHDQQLALLRAQFSVTGHGRRLLRQVVEALATRVRSHAYPYPSGRAIDAVLALPMVASVRVSFA